MARYDYIIGDSIVSTIKFDVLELETREAVTINGQVTMPQTDFILFLAG